MRAAPASTDEITRLFRSGIDDAARSFESELTGFFAEPRTGDVARLWNGGAAAYLMRDLIAAKIPELVKRLHPEAEGGMPEVDRRERLEAMDAELSRLEAELEDTRRGLRLARTELREARQQAIWDKDCAHKRRSRISSGKSMPPWRSTDAWRNVGAHSLAGVDAMTKLHSGSSRALLCAPIAFDHDRAVTPEWLHLLPVHQARAAADCSVFAIDDADAVVAASLPSGCKSMIDAQGVTEGARSSSSVGWLVELQARNSGIWGRFEWTTAGRELIGRCTGIAPRIFLSDDGSVAAIVSVTLSDARELVGLRALRTQMEEVPARSLDEYAVRAACNAYRAIHAQIGFPLTWGEALEMALLDGLHAAVEGKRAAT